MSDITDWAAIAMSVVALGYSIREARQSQRHDRLSVAPRLTADCSIVPNEEISYMRVSNNGLGPAIIKGFRWFLDDKSRQQWNINRFEHLMQRLNVGKGVVFSFPLAGTIIATGASLDLVKVAYGPDRDGRSAEIRAAFRRMRFEIDFTSMYGEAHQSFTFPGAQFYPPEDLGLPASMLPDELRD